MALQIEDYALIGDCKTAALVGREMHPDKLQLDVFDEVLDVMFQTLKAGMEPTERAQILRPLYWSI
jgi:hypothetical protein